MVGNVEIRSLSQTMARYLLDNGGMIIVNGPSPLRNNGMHVWCIIMCGPVRGSSELRPSPLVPGD